MKIPFPVKGLVDGIPSGQQELQTSFSLNNTRAFDITKEKIRGGQRPGTILAYDTQIGTEGTPTPVLFMTSIITTFITPE
jgi:hypothetical protein